MTPLTGLADYLSRLSDRRASQSNAASGALYGDGSTAQRKAVAGQQALRDAVAEIMASDIIRTDDAKHRALYGLAESVNATSEPDFDPAWRP